jgi:hypothetical protein
LYPSLTELKPNGSTFDGQVLRLLIEKHFTDRYLVDTQCLKRDLSGFDQMKWSIASAEHCVGKMSVYQMSFGQMSEADVCLPNV